MFNPFQREELQALIIRCKCLRDSKKTKLDWIRIYSDVINALDHLDAAIARSTIYAKDREK